VVVYFLVITGFAVKLSPAGRESKRFQIPLRILRRHACGFSFSHIQERLPEVARIASRHSFKCRQSKSFMRQGKIHSFIKIQFGFGDAKFFLHSLQTKIWFKISSVTSVIVPGISDSLIVSLP